MTSRRLFTAVLLLVALAATAVAQDGVSTESAARGKFLSNHGVLPSAREISVEDFVNYHRHELPRPKSGQAVALDLRWGNSAAAKGQEAVLQVGLTTALAGDRQHLRPVNLCFVIDRSGSMAAQNKLERVKQALVSLIPQLRATDTISIVTFDSEAEVAVPAQDLERKQDVLSAVMRLRPGSSTNIEAGLVLGYKEVLKHFDREATNRVVLLTDGIANQGVVDPEEIADESKGYNDRGIDLSTIGVGEDLNHDLLRTLAKSGRGLFHFVADDEDIQKVFVKEMQSLLSPVASEPELVVEFDQGLSLEQVYGYDAKVTKNSFRIRLDNMNSGMTEVVLARFKVDRRGSQSVKAKLVYRDLDRNKSVTVADVATLDSRESESADIVADSSVAKNYTIAELAQSMKDMAKHAEEGAYGRAERELSASINSTVRRYPNLEDEDIKRTLTMATKYRDIVREHTGERGVEPTENDHQERTNQGPSIIRNGDFTLGNTGFTSDRDYIKPGVNCLWGGYYTIVSSFSSPEQLHTNVVAKPFSAPGGGQVMFMNSGGTQQFTVWSTKVRCKPNTKYRVSFNEIGLSGGKEWTNTYEIRINGDRSEALLGSDGQYVGVEYTWYSRSATSATVSIVRLPNPHGGGVIGISNIMMVPVKGR